MHWIFHSFAIDDPRPRQHLLENLSVRTRPNAFLAGVEQVLLQAAGNFQAIVFDTFQWDRVNELRFGGWYEEGMQADAVARRHPADTAFPESGLESFLLEFLQARPDRIAVSEQRFDKPDLTPAEWEESRRAINADCLYHYLASDDATPDNAHNFVWDSRNRWGVGLCSRCDEIPPEGRWSEEFLGDLFDNCSHLFTRAFDGEGYLIWTRDFAKRD